MPSALLTIPVVVRSSKRTQGHAAPRAAAQSTNCSCTATTSLPPSWCCSEQVTMGPRSVCFAMSPVGFTADGLIVRADVALATLLYRCASHWLVGSQDLHARPAGSARFSNLFCSNCCGCISADLSSPQLPADVWLCQPSCLYTNLDWCCM
jgi:hypothetical protein